MYEDSIKDIYLQMNYSVMVDITTQKLTRMNRRRFLKVLTGSGISAAALAHMTQDALAEMDPDLGNEVPLLWGQVHTNHKEVRNGDPPERKPIYFTIPQDEWIVIDSARDAEQQIKELSILQGTGVTVGVSTVIRGHQQQKAVVVKYPIEEYPWAEKFRPDVSFEKISNNLPATVKGVAGRGTASATTVEEIPVITEKINPELMFSYDYRYRPVPAGCQWSTEAENLCTMGTPVYDYDASEYRLVTASHCFYNYGDYAHQPNTSGDSAIGARTGKIDFRHDPLFDAAVINVYHGNTDTTYRYAADNGSYRNLNISGSLSEDRLRYMENNNISLKKQGIATGISSGPVTYVSSSSFNVATSHANGDSGCPFYEETHDPNNPNGSMIAGVLRGGDNVAQVTQIENVENRWNVSV